MTTRYQKIIRRRRAFDILFVLSGAAILALLFVVKPIAVPAHMSPFFISTGAAWIANGIVDFYRKSKLLKDAEAFQKAAVLEFDERNTEVQRRSASLTLTVLLYAGYAAMIAASFFSRAVCYTLLSCICAGLLIFFICYAIVWKTM